MDVVRQVCCRGCKTRKWHKDMEIYSVAEDAYYCNQNCKDIADGVIRDKEGYIVDG